MTESVAAILHARTGMAGKSLFPPASRQIKRRAAIRQIYLSGIFAGRFINFEREYGIAGILFERNAGIAGKRRGHPAFHRRESIQQLSAIR